MWTDYRDATALYFVLALIFWLAVFLKFAGG
jgi:hypothetical protein